MKKLLILAILLASSAAVTGCGEKQSAAPAAPEFNIEQSAGQEEAEQVSNAEVNPEEEAFETPDKTQEEPSEQPADVQ